MQLLAQRLLRQPLLAGGRQLVQLSFRRGLVVPAAARLSDVAAKVRCAHQPGATACVGVHHAVRDMRIVWRTLGCGLREPMVRRRRRRSPTAATSPRCSQCPRVGAHATPGHGPR